MSEADKYFTLDKWKRMKYVANGSVKRTIKYVNSWLHYEGLKCLTDGSRYYLDPTKIPAEIPTSAMSPTGAESSLVTARISVRQLATGELFPEKKELSLLTPGVPIRRYSITAGLEKNKDYVPMVEITEVTLKETKETRQYWELFLEQGEDNKLHLALKTFTKKKYILIYWDKIPSQETPSLGLTPEQRETAIPLEYPKEDTLDKDWEVIPKAEEEEKFSLEEGLKYLQLQGVGPKVLEFGHTFLTIGDKTFLISNLWDGFYRVNAPAKDFEENL